MPHWLFFLTCGKLGLIDVVYFLNSNQVQGPLVEHLKQESD